MIRQQSNNIYFSFYLLSFQLIPIIWNNFHSQYSRFILSCNSFLYNTEATLTQFNVFEYEVLLLFSLDRLGNDYLYLLLHNIIVYTKLLEKCVIYKECAYAISLRSTFRLIIFNMSFVTDHGELEAGLFAHYIPRFGAQTVLNINFIPDLLRFIKQRLTSEQVIRLQDYHMQNYLMELSIHYKQQKTLGNLAEHILSHIRSNNHFWYRHNNKQQLDEEQQLKRHAIVKYHEDVRQLNGKFRGTLQNGLHQDYSPEYRRRTAKGFRFRELHSNVEPHFGTRQPINYLAYVPSFILCKMSKIDENNSQNDEQILLKQRLQLKKCMQQCIVFILSNKPETKIVHKAVKSRKDLQDEVQSDQKSESESDQSELEQEDSLFDEFLVYVSSEPALTKFPNSHHMHLLTENIILICQNISLTYMNTSSLVQEDSNYKEETQEILKITKISEGIRTSMGQISQRVLNEQQIKSITLFYLQYWQKELKYISKQLRQRQMSTTNLKGWLSNRQQIERVKQQYQNMLDHPEFVELTKYRTLGTQIPWKDEDYLKFLKGLNEFLNIPTNNKKISQYMGDGFEANHVKHVKNIYLTVMKERAQRGECGGGKRGKSLSKFDFIEKDISNFSMKWFQKSKKIKKRKPKRKRKNSGSDQCEMDVDSQY